MIFQLEQPWDQPDSSTPLSLSNCTVKHSIRDALLLASFPILAPSCRTRWATIPAMAEESNPPLRKTPTGTSAQSRRRTASSRRSLTPAIISASVRVSSFVYGLLALSRPQTMGTNLDGIVQVPILPLFHGAKIATDQKMTGFDLYPFEILVGLTV
jgi:hypothetical protein